MVTSPKHILDHDEQKRVLIDVCVDLTDDHTDAVDDDVNDGEHDGADQVWRIVCVFVILW